MPAAHHLPNPFGPNSAGGTIATELAAYASRHSSPGVGTGLVQAGTQQSAHTLFEWPVACGDMGTSDGGCREVGRKSRRGASESRSPEVSMHSCSGADLASLDSPRSMRHGGGSSDSLTAHYCQVCCRGVAGQLACIHTRCLHMDTVSPSVTHSMVPVGSIRTVHAPGSVTTKPQQRSALMLCRPSAGGRPGHSGAADPRRRRAAAGLRGGGARGGGAGGGEGGRPPPRPPPAHRRGGRGGALRAAVCRRGPDRLHHNWCAGRVPSTGAFATSHKPASGDGFSYLSMSVERAPAIRPSPSGLSQYGCMG